MRLPVQALPVARTIRGLRPPRAIALSSWSSCMISCINSALNTSGLAACSQLTNVSAYIQCAVAVMGEANQTSIAIAEAGCVFQCAF